MGLTYAQARYYNPVTARFSSPDPVGFAAGGPGYFNRYAYTMNDPVNLVDPDGRCPNCVSGGIGAAVGGLFGAGAALVSELRDDTPGVNYGRVARGGAKGAVVGGIVGATGNVALGTGAAALMGGAEGAATAASQEGASVGRVALGAASGALVDGAGALAGGGAGKAVGSVLGASVRGQVGAEVGGNAAGAIGAAVLQATVSNTPQIAGAVRSGIERGASSANDALARGIQGMQDIGEPDPLPADCRGRGGEC